MQEAVMAGLIAFWRCQCGAALRLLGEVDSTPPATQSASCPRCHRPIEIPGDRITSITEDKSELSQALGRCEEKERLLAAHSKAFDIYRRTVAQLADAAGKIAQADFAVL